MMTSSVARAAESLVRAGFSVIPVRADGSKAPATNEWKSYQAARINPSDIPSVFAGQVGIAVLGGSVSGNLEVLDFDQAKAFEEWRAIVEQLRPGLLEKLPQVATPDGGRHVFYRCAVIESNQKLAMAKEAFRTASGKQKLVKIETRGEGGYVIAPPSPPGCHEFNKPYLVVGGLRIEDTPTIETAERAAMFSAARALSETARVVHEPPQIRAQPGNGDRPGDVFNSRGPSWNDILEPHGWTAAFDRGAVTYWRRPGKKSGISATTGKCGEFFYNFSSSAAPFDSDRAYNKFSAYSLLNHGGDFSAAAKTLGSMGYGERREPPMQAQHTQPQASSQSVVEPFPTHTYSGLPSPARWLWPQLIEQGTCAVIGAEPKAGKSWITFDMAISLATGQRFLGDFTPAERGTTLLYSPEGSSRSQHGRLVGLCWGREVPPEIVLPSVHFLDARLDLNAEDHAARLGATIDAVGARLVVVDPMVSAAMGIDENASGEVMRILSPLRDLIKARPNCALIVVHHTNKMARGQAMSLGLRGSSAIMGWLDTLITLRRAEDDSSGPRRVDIAHRDAAAPEPLGFQLGYGQAEEASGLQWFRLTRCEAPDVEGKRKEAAPISESVLAVMTDGAWISGNDVVKKSHRQRNQVLDELRRQAALGVVEYEKKLGYRVVPGSGTTSRGYQQNDE